MIIDFNQDLLDLEGNPVIISVSDTEKVPQHIGKLLARSLVNGQSKEDAEIMKYNGWAKKIYNGQPLNLDRADKKMLREFVRLSETLSVLSKGQIFDIIDGSVDE
jgi:hypothetical protein